jgi:DNA-binding MarR family transcriptional regulator
MSVALANFVDAWFMNACEMYEYLERISNLIRTSVRKSGQTWDLQPIQFEALHYLSRCNRYSNTPVGVAEFLGLTKGTVSQTLRVLENHGLVEKHTDLHDRRVVHLTVTLVGGQVLDEAVPPPLFKAALVQMPDAERHHMEQTMATLLRRLQQANQLKTFGTCKTCVHHQRRNDGLRQCGLTQEILDDFDAEKICREHLTQDQGASE